MKNVKDEVKDALKAILQQKPSVEVVYFNEMGEYMLFPVPGYDRKISREDILDNKIVAEDYQDGTASAVDQKLLDKHAEDVEAFLIEKKEYDENRAAFLDEREALELEKTNLAAAIEAFAEKEKQLEGLIADKTELETVLKAKNTEIGTLKGKITNLEKKS